jgi:sporulation protein YlmC with PRC-barrel domain
MMSVMAVRLHRDLVGKHVVGSTGRVIGTITDLGVEDDLSKVTSLVLKVDPRAVKDLKVSKPFLKSATLEVPASLISAAKDVVILKVSIEELAATAKPSPPTETSPAPDGGKPV